MRKNGQFLNWNFQLLRIRKTVKLKLSRRYNYLKSYSWKLIERCEISPFSASQNTISGPKTYCAKSVSSASENTKKAQKWSIFKLEISASENTKNSEIKDFFTEIF